MKSEQNQSNKVKPVLGFFSSTVIVVASMIGTGIFTTTGFLVADLGSTGPVLLLWVVGGGFALCGALSYGELSAALPRSGGEYHFLRRIYHPLLGFLAGWISLIVGFSAPIAAAAMAFGKYTGAIFPHFPTLWGALILVVLLSFMHMIDVKGGSYIQNIFTLVKVLLLLIFIIFGFLYSPSAVQVPVEKSLNWSTIFSPAFAVGLIVVSFAYSGWNGATYVISEVKRPKKTIPLALITGTVLVMVFYFFLNVVFLRAVPLSELANVVEVGHIAATHLFGPATAKFISLLIALSLISTISALVMTGPRVYSTAGQDFPLFTKLATLSSRGVPVFAIGLQAVVAIVMILTATFDKLLIYVGFTLSLSTGLTVAGVLFLRFREPNLPRPYRTWGYPVVPILYILLCLWMVIHSISIRPIESLAGVLTLGIGILIYYYSKRSNR